MKSIGSARSVVKLCGNSSVRAHCAGQPAGRGVCDWEQSLRAGMTSLALSAPETRSLGIFRVVHHGGEKAPGRPY